MRERTRERTREDERGEKEWEQMRERMRKDEKEWERTKGERRKKKKEKDTLGKLGDQMEMIRAERIKPLYNESSQKTQNTNSQTMSLCL